MKIAVLTSNSLRHKFFAKTLASYVDDALIISECKSNNVINSDVSNVIDEHFKLRDETEKNFFLIMIFLMQKLYQLLTKN